MKRPIVVAAILLAIFISALEATVIATAMPTVVGDLGGLELYGWVSAVYMLAATITIPVYGKLADLFGRKPILLTGLAIFVAGSVGSGLAHSMGMLIAMRAVQGFGAGGIQPVALTIVGDLFPPAQRARLQGLIGAVWGVAGIAGPLVGGLIVRALSWRWVFYVNVPVGGLAAVLLGVGLVEPAREPGPRPPIDFLGVALLTTAVLALLAGAHGNAGWLWPTAALFAVLFVLHERRHRAPLVPMDLMVRPLIAVSSINGAVVGAVMSATVIYVPLYVASVLFGTPTQAGLAVAPMLVGWPLASTLSGRILLTTGPRPLVRVGFSIVAVASVLLDALVTNGAGTTPLLGAMFVLGTGMGLANTALIIAVQESVGFAQRGVVTANSMFFRSIGGALAVGMLGAVMAHILAGRVPEDVLDALLGPMHGRGLDPATLRGLGATLHEGMAPIFHVLAGISVLGAVSGLFFPRVSLTDQASKPAQTPTSGSSASGATASPSSAGTGTTP